MNSTISQMYTPLCYGGKIHIENEVILPDYCSDISRVVKAQINPKITAKNTFADENGLNVVMDGTALFKIIYLAEGSDKLHSTFFTETFSHSFKVQADKNSDFDNVFLHINLLSENVSCRPTASRRMVIRCDINVMPDIRINRRVEYFDASQADCESLKEKITLCTMYADAEADYNVSHKINLPRELPQAQEILDCDIRYACESLKVGDSKAVFNATAFFTCFYSSDDGDISFCQPIELAQVIDIPSSMDASQGEIRFAPTSLRADIDVDNYGENRVIDLDFSYTAHVAAFGNSEVEISKDVFSPQREFDAEYGDFALRTFVKNINEKIPVTGSLKLKNPETVTFEDIRPTAYIRGWVIENGMLNLDGRLNLKMIGAFDGGYDGVEENLDFSVQIKADDAPVQQCDLSIAVREVDCIVGTNSIEVRADIMLGGSLFIQNSVKCVKSMSVGEKKKDASRPPIILYYPSHDETLWDIAKKYSLPQKLICEFNGMESDKITDGVIKIPSI